MEFVRLLLTGILILIGARIIFTDENLENNSDLTVKDRLPNYIRPVHYDIQLTVKNNTNGTITIFGHSKINISIDLPTRNISLHAQKPHVVVSDITLYKQFPLTYYKPENCTYNNKNHILVFHFNNEIPRGRYILIISFSNEDSSNEGFFKTFYGTGKENKRWIAVTNFYPIGARQVFPCWDEPAIRMHFNISIKHHRNYSVLSNMPIKTTSSLQDGMELTLFHITPIISTYQIVISLFDSVIRLGSIWCRSYLLPMNLANSIFYKITLLGFKWELNDFRDVEHIAIPTNQFDDMGYWRLISYKETAITYDDKIDPVGRKINMACLIAREAARQWFSNIVSPSWWSYLWLNEGIAVVLGLAITSEIFPSYEFLSIVQMKHESLRLDTQSIMKPLISQINSPSDIYSVLSFSYYIKGPAILHMLQQMVTNKIFLNGLHNYLKKHMHGAATIDDFWTAMQDALDKPRKSEFDLKEMFHSWTYYADYPILRMQQAAENKIKIYIWQEDVNIIDLTEWWLPVTYTTQKYPDFNENTLEYTLRLSTNWYASTNSPAKDDWIIANLQQIGYYRVNYDMRNWIRIANYLNSKEYTKLHVLNRAQIIDDAYHFLVTDKQDLNTFLELVDYLKQETNYTAWYPMIKALEDMSCFFPFQESANIKNKMRLILDGILEKIGYEENSNKDDILNSLRQEAAKWACILDSDMCKTQALLKLRSHLANNKSTLLPYWKQWTYCNGFKEYSYWMKAFNNSREECNTIGKFVVCCDVTIIYNYLTSENYNKSQTIDRINIFLSIIARHARNNFMLGYILTNFEQIKPREVSTIVLLINIINHVYSKEQLNQINAFVENYEVIVPVNKMFFDQNIWHSQGNKCMKTVKIFENISLFLKRKMETRLSEIKCQVDRYDKVIKISYSKFDD